jgi:hypothetical protein
MTRPILLICGILSSLLYVAMNVLVPMHWSGYSSASQTVSELSAIGSPTRSLWAPFGALYAVLFAAFGAGVRHSAGSNRALKMAGTALVALGILYLLWPPMHLRGAEFSLTDILHIAFAIATLSLMLIAIGFGAAALGKGFRLYSVATTAVFVIFGALTGLDAPHVAANEPTPWIGVWERINIGAFLLWIAVLAIELLSGQFSSRDTSRLHLATARR